VKLVHLVGFIIKKFVTMHGHTNVKSLKHILQVKLPQHIPVHSHILLKSPTSTAVSLVLKQKCGQLTGASRTVMNAGEMH
jgi:hypothetical protein